MEPPTERELERAELIRTYNHLLRLLEGSCFTFDELVENLTWVCLALEQHGIGEVGRKRVQRLSKYLPNVQQRERALHELAKRCYLGEPPPEQPDIGDELARRRRSA